MSEPEVLLSGLGIPESPRWHEGRLWFCNWIERQVVAVGLDGRAEVMPVRADRSFGYSIAWRPDGRLLITGDQVRAQQPDGSMTALADQGANEIVVDQRGYVYVNGADFDFAGGETPKPGFIKLITPDGRLRQVADDIQFPNGMVITPDDRTLIISESFAGRLTAFDIDPDGGLSAGGCSPKGWDRTASASTPRARYGSPRAGSRSPGWLKAARFSSRWSWRRTGPRSR